MWSPRAWREAISAALLAAFRDQGLPLSGQCKAHVFTSQELLCHLCSEVLGTTDKRVSLTRDKTEAAFARGMPTLPRHMDSALSPPNVRRRRSGPQGACLGEGGHNAYEPLSVLGSFCSSAGILQADGHVMAQGRARYECPCAHNALHGHDAHSSRL